MSATDQPSVTQQAGAGGGTVGAASLLAIVGVLAVFQGFAAILRGPTFVIGFEYVYKIDPVAWGWIHLLVGAAAVTVAVGLFLNRTWAAVAAIVICGISIVTNFLWLPYYPWWSVIVIALDVFIIWSVSIWHQHPAVELLPRRN